MEAKMIMTIGEKLGYNKDLLDKYFSEWVNGPGWKEEYTNDFFPSDRTVDVTMTQLKSESYKCFLEWMFLKYNELYVGDITTDGVIVVEPCLKNNIMKFRGLNIFSTGWAYHINVLRSKKQNLSKPFVGYDRDFFLQSHLVGKSKSSYDDLLHNIDNVLHEHDPEWKDPDKIGGWHFCATSYCTKEEKVFYREYDKVLIAVKEAILSGKFKLDAKYINKILY